MKPTNILLIVLVAVGLVAVKTDLLAAPGDASRSAHERSGRAEIKFNECGAKYKGPLVIDCVSLAVKAFALDLGGCGYIKAVAPKLASTVMAAADEISSAKTKIAALSVLSKTTGALRGQSTSTTDEAKSVYSRANRALDVAVGVIDKKAQ